MALTIDQEQIADQFLDFMLGDDHNVMVIRGSAGTGKSFLTRHLIQSVYKQMRLLSVLLGLPVDAEAEVFVTATTNKAAKVVAEFTGKPPRTIHSLLGVVPVKNYKTGKSTLRKTKNYMPQARSVLFIDESSFIDDEMLDMIQKSVTKCKVVFIGDPYQLTNVDTDKPPVFEQGFLTAELTQQVRSPGPIAKLGLQFRDVLNGADWPEIKDNGDTIRVVEGPTFKQMVEDTYLDTYKTGILTPGDEDKQRILAWTNERVVQYNEHIRELLGYDELLVKGEYVVSNSFMPDYAISVDQHLMVEDIGRTRTVHDVVGRDIKLSDHPYVFVPNDPLEGQNKLKLFAKQKAWRDYYYIKENWGDLRPLYASTVHKSQGSSYDTVFIDLSDIGRNTKPDEVARLMYVATSRAKKQVVFYGELPEKYRG